MKFTHLILFLLFALSTPSVFGQKFLQKPYKEWTKEDVVKILSDSPWVSQYQSERGLAAAAIQQQQREQADTRLSGSDRGNLGRGAVPIPIVIRLHSAMPVREGMVRNQQLGAGYDKMNAEDQKKFDESTAKFLECAVCKGYFVVTLTKWKDTSTSVSEGIFGALKLEDLKGKVWLMNDRDEKLDLAQFTPPKTSSDSAVFFFKRPDDRGKPFFTPGDKLVRFVFASELRDTANEYSSLLPKSFEFKVAKMLIDGKIEF